MDFKIRKAGEYLQISVSLNDQTIDLGLNDRKELFDMLHELKHAGDTIRTFLGLDEED